MSSDLELIKKLEQRLKGPKPGALFFKPHPKEVAEVIELPLRRLMSSRHIQRETWTGY